MLIFFNYGCLVKRTLLVSIASVILFVLFFVHTFYFMILLIFRFDLRADCFQWKY